MRLQMGGLRALQTRTAKALPGNAGTPPQIEKVPGTQDLAHKIMLAHHPRARPQHGPHARRRRSCPAETLRPLAPAAAERRGLHQS